MFSIHTKSLCRTVLATALLVSFSAQAASDDARITAETDVKPLVTLSAQESQAMSLAAGRILLHADNARVAIFLEDRKTALDEVNQALTLVEVVENVLPKYKITTKITTGDVTYTDESEVSRRFVSIFDEQYIEDVIAPVVQAKIDKSNEGDKEADEIVAVVDYSVWRKSAMKLNIDVAEDTLSLAKLELEKGNADTADIALALLQTDGVVFEFVEVELPLVEAADNLKLAQLEISEGSFSQAQATLQRASDNLQIYEEIASDSRAEDVRELHQEIDKLAKSLTEDDHSKSALKKIEDEITSYWQHVVKWFK